MKRAPFAVMRPSFFDHRDGYAIDHYDGSGKWNGTARFPDKESAQRHLARVRRLLAKERKRRESAKP